jgi:hypothetical protein
MFYIFDSIPVPPLLDFNHVQPSSLEVFKRITEAMEKRSKIVASIVSISREEQPASFDPSQVAEALSLSMDIVA